MKMGRVQWSVCFKLVAIALAALPLTRAQNSTLRRRLPALLVFGRPAGVATESIFRLYDVFYYGILPGLELVFSRGSSSDAA